MNSPPGAAGTTVDHARPTATVHRMEREVPGACPLDCPDGCSWIVTVRDGEAVKLRGTPDHPFTRGALCTRSRATSTTRARPTACCTRCAASAPRARAASSGSAGTTRIGEMAERLHRDPRRARRRGDLAVPGHGHARLPPGPRGPLGRPAVERARRQRPRDDDLLGRRQRRACAARSGTNATMDPEGFARARLILLWGSNPLTSHHHFWKFVARGRAGTARTSSSIDPVRTRTAAQADEHLAPLPGTDAALALALMHEVVRATARTTRPSCATAREGWDALPRADPAYPPERAAAICDLPVERIEALGAPARDDAADRDPRHDGHPAPRGRRHGAAHARRDPRGDRRLARCPAAGSPTRRAATSSGDTAALAARRPPPAPRPHALA